MIPYADDTPSYSFPIWVVILIVLNAFIFFSSATGKNYDDTIYSFGCIPARFFSHGQPIDISQGGQLTMFEVHVDTDQEDWAPPFVTLFTSMFLHGSIFHLIGNMWFLWLFGDNVEDRMGKATFPIFYFLSGLVGNILHVLFFSDSTVPAIGASGAIAGVMGAYIYLFPKATIASITGYFLYFFTFHISAVIYLGLWFLLQLAGGLTALGTTNIAFWAHIGGFASGFGLVLLLDMARGITKYPGDRGYTAVIPPAIEPPGLTPRRRRRYVWRE
jgi:membrane associated rhomboid family serine protease